MVNAAKRAVHYGWYVVAVSMLGIFACLGLGRFALGMLLPAMAQALALLDAADITGGVALGRFQPDLSDCILVAVTEKRTRQELDCYVAALS